MTAARMRIGSLASEAWKARAAPRKPLWIDGGRPISRAAPLMASTASPSEAPGARLNEIVTAGNWPWCAITRGVAQHRLLAQAREQPRRPQAQLLLVRVLEAILELRAAHAVLDGEVLHRLQVERDAGDVGQRRPQAIDHLGDAGALGERLEVDEQAPAVEGDVGAVHADEGGPPRHGRVVQEHAREPPPAP